MQTKIPNAQRAFNLFCNSTEGARLGLRKLLGRALSEFGAGLRKAQTPRAETEKRRKKLCVQLGLPIWQHVSNVPPVFCLQTPNLQDKPGESDNSLPQKLAAGEISTGNPAKFFCKKVLRDLGQWV